MTGIDVTVNIGLTFDIRDEVVCSPRVYRTLLSLTISRSRSEQGSASTLIKE